VLDLGTSRLQKAPKEDPITDPAAMAMAEVKDRTKLQKMLSKRVRSWHLSDQEKTCHFSSPNVPTARGWVTGSYDALGLPTRQVSFQVVPIAMISVTTGNNARNLTPTTSKRFASIFWR
jgi:hypothetical protein